MESPSHLTATESSHSGISFVAVSVVAVVPVVLASGTKKRPNHESGLKNVNI